jgi:hypothetical protein
MVCLLEFVRIPQQHPAIRNPQRGKSAETMVSVRDKEYAASIFNDQRWKSLERHEAGSDLRNALLPGLGRNRKWHIRFGTALALKLRKRNENRPKPKTASKLKADGKGLVPAWTKQVLLHPNVELTAARSLFGGGEIEVVHRRRRGQLLAFEDAWAPTITLSMGRSVGVN